MDLLQYLSLRIRQVPGSLKRKYRSDMVKALINSYPEGKLIPTTEFKAALQYPIKSTGALSLIHRMEERGEISRKLISGSGPTTKCAYKVLISGNTYDEERKKFVDLSKPEDQDLRSEGYVNPAQVHAQRLRRAKEAEMLSNELEEANMEEDSAEKVYTFSELEELAIKFQFYRGGGSMTAAQFLEKLKEE